jgi:hypothetical protein
MIWYLGENRYFYTQVSSSSSTTFTITSATYVIYNVNASGSAATLVTSGTATVEGTTIYTRWAPTVAGTYVAIFSYVIGEETFESRQVIEVVETM